MHLFVRYRRRSFRGLLMETSKGWTRLVNPAGIKEGVMLDLNRRSRIAEVLWDPIKSIANRVGRPLSTGRRWFVMYRSNKPSFMYAVGLYSTSTRGSYYSFSFPSLLPVP